MISIDPAEQTDHDNYKLLIGSVVPRPIAFVTTLSQEGTLNAAPFSYFSIVASHPPLLSLSVQRKAGKVKDTTRNTIDRGELVIHITDETIIEQVNLTASNLPPDKSEIDLTHLTPVASDLIAVPGIKEPKIRMECRLEQAIALGGTNEQPACDLLIVRVVRFHIAEDVYQNGRILAEQLHPISRMAGHDYTKLGEKFTLARPE
ncbi:flavin reductase family protein [Paenibacillus taiwanensis]|uniref:flavin reductase family protein n=1 Tax=Paenibacillus taiwanensis TaxID=401638 RepID=UPI0004202D30|nr:flavin reductase family protein [Paenibacillus taiwanensis]